VHLPTISTTCSCTHDSPLYWCVVTSPTKATKSLDLVESNAKPVDNLLQDAKALFRRTAVPARLVGRAQERETIIKFWKAHVLDNKSGCLYISGSPGTGKSAMLREIIAEMEPLAKDATSHSIKVCSINCMSVKEPKAIYSKLVSELKGPRSAMEADVVQQAEKLLNGKSKAIK
jgi:cell division control protein 6